MRRFDQRRNPRTAHARHILIATKPKAIEILDEIRESKRPFKTFKKLAKRYSTCPSGTKGGDLGEFIEGQMAQAFEEGVWAAHPEEPPTTFHKSQFGYHIIWVHWVRMQP